MTEHPPTKQHNYVAKIQQLYNAAGIRRGQINVAEVRHDDWCDVYRTDASHVWYCNCDPEIVLEDGRTS